MKRKLASIAVIGITLFMAGCADKIVNETTNSPQMKKLLRNNQVVIPNYKPVKIDRYVLMDGITIKQAIQALNEIYGTNYFFDGENIVLPKSNFKVRTPKDLKYYVSETTQYKLNIKPVYNKNKIVKVTLLPKKFKQGFKYDVEGESDLFTELFKLRNAGFNILINQSVMNEPIVLSIGTTNPIEFLKSVCQTGNVWCDITADRSIKVNKYKTFNIDITLDGKITFTDGGNTGSSGGSTSGGDNGGNNNAQAVSTLATGGISYKISNMDYKSLLNAIEGLFDENDVDMYEGKNGYITFRATPSQYKLIQKYFEEKAKKSEVIKAKIQILRVDLKDEFKWGVNWNALTKRFGFVQRLQNIDPLNDTGAILEYKNFGWNKKITDVSPESRKVELDGLLEALETYGQVHKVDEFFTQSRAGEPIPFSDYQTVKYFTISTESSGGDTNNTETSVEVNQEIVGFKGNLVVTKNKKGYDINGYINQSFVTGFETLATPYGTLKAPNVSGKVVKISTHISRLNRTLIVGGFLARGFEKNDVGTPILNKIPVIKYFFNQKDDLTKNSQFIILVTLYKAQEGQLK